MVGWHYRLNEREFEQPLGDSEGQGSLACCSPWDCRVRHDLVTGQQNQQFSCGHKTVVFVSHSVQSTLSDCMNCRPTGSSAVEFSRQEYWSGQPLPSSGDLPKPWIEPRSPALQTASLTYEPPGKPSCFGKFHAMCILKRR